MSDTEEDKSTASSLPTREIAETERIARQRNERKFEKPNPRSRTATSRLHIPVGRVEKLIDDMRISKKRSPESAIYASAAIQVVISTIMQAAAGHAKDANRCKVKRPHIQKAISQDPELLALLSSAIIPDCGKINNPQPVMLKSGWEARRRARKRAQLQQQRQQ